MKKSDILQAMTIVKPGLSSKEIIEQASSFAFINGRIVTYNDEISIAHPVEGIEFEGAIKAEILYGLLSKIKGDDIDLTIKGNELLITSGRTKAGITFQEEVKLPLDEITDKKKWKKLPTEFAKHLKFAADACSADMSSPKMTCVNVVKEGLLQASDNYKILQIKLQGELPVESFLIPASSSFVVSKMNPIHISESSGWIHFKNEANTVISCRIFEDIYPDIEKILKVKGINLTLPQSLTKTLERAGIFSKREHTIDEMVSLTIEHKKLLVKAKSDNGWFEESLNIAYEGDSLIFHITPYLLQDIITETLDCILSNDRIKFETDEWIYVSILKTL